MAFVEIEQKYRLKSPVKVRALLKKLKAKKVLSGVESNEFYDQGHFLRKKKIALRLRRFGRGLATLTLKGPRIRSRFTKRMEIETPVDYVAARGFLRFLGCRLLRQYSKKRELYKIGPVSVTLDHLKGFGWFVEIEGSPASIKIFEKKLDLSSGDREERSYLQMLFRWKH